MFVTGWWQFIAGRKEPGPVASKPCAWLLLSFMLTIPFAQAETDRCLFVSSYHQGYAWSDGVERGLRAVLQGRCELRQFDMDSKRRKDEVSKQEAALAVKRLIEEWRPDVVITADDNAAKYLIQPYYRDKDIPFVFCGINWSGDAYGLPYRNTTGMIEIAPIAPMFDTVAAVRGSLRTAFYLGADTLTERKNLRRFEAVANRYAVKLEHALVSTMTQWLAAYARAQEFDFVILGSNAGINDWRRQQVIDRVCELTRRITVTNHAWMMPYAILGFTKIPEEQGEWAGKAALHILRGVKPADIPIVSNRKWDIWVNHDILERSGLGLPEMLRKKAKKAS